MSNLPYGMLAIASGIVAPWLASAAVNEYTLRIDRQPLTATLKEFAEQTGLQVVYLADTLGSEDRLVGPLQGLYTAESALGQLLAHSGLVSIRINDRTISIVRSDEMKGAARQTRTALQFVAQTGPAPRPLDTQVSSAPVAGGDRQESDGGDMEEVVVTGSHIRGQAPIGSSLIVIGREEITSSGHGRLQDFVETITQNFGGDSEDSQASGVGNLGRSQSINLRGAGSGSTLILVNGRRQPLGALQGIFVDVSSIPASAVDRIEILTDGASALYGSDAVGGVVNFVLRKDYDGMETNVRVASTDEAADELQVSQLFGTNWDGGNILVGYEYSLRDALMAADRPYGSLNLDYRSLGGSDLRGTNGVPGTILNPVTRLPAYAIPAGQDGNDLTVADLIPGQANYLDTVNGIARYPEQKLHTAFVTLSHAVSDSVELFADARYGKREMELPFSRWSQTLTIPATHPQYINPFGTGSTVLVNYNLANDLGISTQLGETETFAVAAGANIAMGADWKLNLTASTGGEKNEWRWINITDFVRPSQCVSGLPSSPCPGAPINPFGDAPNDPATIAYIRDIQLGQGDYSVHSLTAIADGPVFDLPTGAVRFAFGVDYRDEDLKGFRGNLAPSTGVFTPSTTNGMSVGHLDRQVGAVFGELAIPLLNGGVGPLERVRIEMSLAGRYEDYSDFGETFNPKAGLTLSPIAGLQLRGSWGTSFRAPNFKELSPTANPSTASATLNAVDPLSPTGRSNVLVIRGANPDLHEETADTWTAGLDINPTLLYGVSFSATYFDLDYKDKVASPSNALVLQLPAVWAAIITRNPTQAQVAEVCGMPTFSGACPGTVNAIVDSRIRNLAGLHVNGADVEIGYRVPLPVGGLMFRIGGTRLLGYETTVTGTAPTTDELDTVGRPLSTRLRGSIGWDFSGWNASATVNYSNDYRDTTRNRPVDSWTTLDAMFSYEFSGGGWLEGTHLQLSAVNVLDEDPPFIDQGFGYDGANATEVGRSIAFSVRKHW